MSLFRRKPKKLANYLLGEGNQLWEVWYEQVDMNKRRHDPKGAMPVRAKIYSVGNRRWLTYGGAKNAARDLAYANPKLRYKVVSAR